MAADSAQRAIAWLTSKQDKAGGWSVPQKPGQPHLPAITALALNGMLLDGGLSASDPVVTRAVAYILSHQKPDGGIYDTILPSYNTAISISALARIDTREARDAVAKAVEFLKNSQWGVTTPMGVGGAAGKESPQTVPESHAFFGGWGYGNRGRPDLSNTAFALQALHDAGLGPDDAAVKRAMIFLQRCQMLDVDSKGKPVNDMAYAKGSKQGGFIYATAENDKTIGQGQSFAGVIEETMDDGTKVSKLRAYGSVSYMGFKSYLYAGLKQDDPRVVAVVDFLRKHYTVSQNPGMGSDGQYYYYIMLSRALQASGTTTIAATDSAGRTTDRDWRRDLTLQLASLQNADGSFMSIDDRWMENNPELITAYALLAIQHVRK
jgi:squalene-hopene/tetraprenyl-beta-curcumene cyclase